LAAYVDAGGSVAATAVALGIATSTTKRHLPISERNLGCPPRNSFTLGGSGLAGGSEYHVEPVPRV
jgi:hypothetical protein